MIMRRGQLASSGGQPVYVPRWAQLRTNDAVAAQAIAKARPSGTVIFIAEWAR
jgi:hypothetical protein